VEFRYGGLLVISGDRFLRFLTFRARSSRNRSLIRCRGLFFLRRLFSAWAKSHLFRGGGHGFFSSASKSFGSFYFVP